MALGVVLTLSGTLFTVDDANLYHRSALFPVGMGAFIVVLAGDFALAVRYRDRMGARGLLTIAGCIVLVAAACAVQAFVYGLNLGTMTASIGAILLLFEVQDNAARGLAEHTRQLAQAERELAEASLSAATSQIQPHFIRNSLGTIHYLCLTEPEEAARAVDLLASYMEAVLGATHDSALSAISDEVDHVRDYLKLRRTSSPDKVRFRIRNDAKDAGGFYVPTLSVLTLVENAVQHGIGPKRGGGTITVTTRELADRFEVEVADDGVGFDPEAAPDGARPHIGLVNTRYRVERCGGELALESEPGRGTRATIRMPKQGGDK